MVVSIQNEFQFHTGSIKSLDGLPVPSSPTSFQFHTGSIKSIQSVSHSISQKSFNSILVRLKVKDAGVDTAAEEQVSIPYWFD